MAITQNKIEIEVEVVGIENAKNKIESVGESSEHLKDGIKGVGESFKSVGDVVEKSGGLMGGAFGALGESVLSITESVGMFKDGLEVAGKSGARSWLLMLGPLAAVAGGVALLIEAVREFTGAAKEAEMMEAAMSATAGELTAIYEEMAEKGINPARREMAAFVQTTIEGRLALELLNEKTANMSKNFKDLLSTQKAVKEAEEAYYRTLTESTATMQQHATAKSALAEATKKMRDADLLAKEAVADLNREFETMYPILQEQIEARRLMVLTYEDSIKVYEDELKKQEDLLVREEQVKGKKANSVKVAELQANAERTLAKQIEQHRLELEALNKLGLTNAQLTERTTELKKKQAIEVDRLTKSLQGENETTRLKIELQEANANAANKTTTATKGATLATIDYFEVTRREFLRTLDVVNREYVIFNESQVRLAGGIENFNEKHRMELERQAYDLSASISDLRLKEKERVTTLEGMGEAHKSILDEENKMYNQNIEAAKEERAALEARVEKYEKLWAIQQQMKKGSSEWIKVQTQLNEVLAGKETPDYVYEQVWEFSTRVDQLKQKMIGLRSEEEKLSMDIEIDEDALKNPNQSVYVPVEGLNKRFLQKIPAFETFNDMLNKLGDLETSIEENLNDKMLWGEKGLVFKRQLEWYKDFWERNTKPFNDMLRSTKVKEFGETILSAFKINKAEADAVLKQYDTFTDAYKYKVDENFTAFSEYNEGRLKSVKEVLSLPKYTSIGINQNEIENITNFGKAISLVLSKSTEKNKGQIRDLVMGLIPAEGDKALSNSTNRLNELLSILMMIPKNTGIALSKSFEEGFLMEEDYLNKASDRYAKINKFMRDTFTDIFQTDIKKAIDNIDAVAKENIKNVGKKYAELEAMSKKYLEQEKERAIEEAGSVEAARIIVQQGGKDHYLTLEQMDAHHQQLAIVREAEKQAEILKIQKKAGQDQAQILEDTGNGVGEFGERITTYYKSLMGLDNPEASSRRVQALDAEIKKIQEKTDQELEILKEKNAAMEVEELEHQKQMELIKKQQYAKIAAIEKLKEEEIKNQAIAQQQQLMDFLGSQFGALYEGQVSSISSGLANIFNSDEFENKQKDLEANRKSAMKQYEGDLKAQVEIEQQYQQLKRDIAKEDENRISNLLKAQLKSLAIESTQKALYETAMGFAAAAIGGPFGGASAADHFTAAGLFAGVATLSGIASAAAGSPSTSSASTSISPTGASQTMSTETRETADKTEPVVFNINFSGANIYDSRESAMRAFSNQIASFMSEPRRGSYYIQAR
jgi:hypothetical protein